MIEAGGVWWNGFSDERAAFVKVESLSDDGERATLRVYSCSDPRGRAWPPVGTAGIGEILERAMTRVL